MNALKWLLVAVLAVGLTACGGAGNKTTETGGMKFNIAASAIKTSAEAHLAITYPNGTVEKFDGTLPWDFVETPCPVGHYSYVVSASTTDGATFDAAGALDVTAGLVTRIDVMLEQNNATPMTVVAPFVGQIMITNLPATGHAGWRVPLKLKATVTHPDNDRPDMDWFISTWSHQCKGEEIGGHGFFFLPFDIDFYIDGWSRPTATVSTTFTSFCQGVETITFEAVNTNNLFCPDKGCALVSRVSFDIPYDPQGIGMDIAFNYSPVVSCGLVDNAEPSPGSEISIVATAFDPDGVADDAPMTFKWTTSDGCGSFKDGVDNKLDVTWIAPAAECQECTLRLDVVDAKGAKNYGTIGVKTAPADLAVGCPAVPPT